MTSVVSVLAIKRLESWDGALFSSIGICNVGVLAQMWYRPIPNPWARTKSVHGSIFCTSNQSCIQFGYVQTVGHRSDHPAWHEMSPPSFFLVHLKACSWQTSTKSGYLALVSNGKIKGDSQPIWMRMSFLCSHSHMLIWLLPWKPISGFTFCRRKHLVRINAGLIV